MRRRGTSNWKSRGVFQKITTEQLDRRVSVCEVCGTCGGRKVIYEVESSGTQPLIRSFMQHPW